MPITGTFVGVGVAPRVASADAIGTSRVKVTYSEPMTLDVALLLAATYTITPDGGSDARSVLSVVAEPFVSHPSYVELQLDGELTVAGANNYLVTVADTVSDAAGNTLDPAFDTADFTGVHTSLDIDHCAIAKDRLAWQFHNKPNIEAIVCAAGDRTQEIDQALADVAAFRSIEKAFGTTQDNVGSNLGIVREGLDDATYRVRQRARAMVIASGGHPDELIDILTVLDDGFAPASIAYEDSFPAAIILRCLVPLGEQPLGEKFANFLFAAKPAGVKLILEYEDQGATLFSWAASVDDASPPANSGWAETSGGIGGIWQEAVGSDAARRGL